MITRRIFLSLAGGAAATPLVAKLPSVPAEPVPVEPVVDVVQAPGKYVANLYVSLFSQGREISDRVAANLANFGIDSLGDMSLQFTEQILFHSIKESVGGQIDMMIWPDAESKTWLMKIGMGEKFITAGDVVKVEVS